LDFVVAFVCSNFSCLLCPPHSPLDSFFDCHFWHYRRLFSGFRGVGQLFIFHLGPVPPRSHRYLFLFSLLRFPYYFSRAWCYFPSLTQRRCDRAPAGFGFSPRLQAEGNRPKLTLTRSFYFCFLVLFFHSFSNRCFRGLILQFASLSNVFFPVFPLPTSCLCFLPGF